MKNEKTKNWNLQNENEKLKNRKYQSKSLKVKKSKNQKIKKSKSQRQQFSSGKARKCRALFNFPVYILESHGTILRKIVGREYCHSATKN